MTKISGIYKIARNDKSKESSECYVGQSVDCLRRKNAHFYLLRRLTHPSAHLQSVFNKYGERNLSLEIIEAVAPSKDALEKAEQKWFDILNPQLNKAPVAGSCLGVKHSEELKAKRSKEMRGNTRGFKKGMPSLFKGRKHTMEANTKNAEKHRRPNPSARRPKSPEIRLKISMAKKGKPNKRKGVPSGLKGKPWSEARLRAYQEGRAYTGHRWNDEERTAVSQRKKGQPAWNKGVPLPEAQKRHLSEINAGKPSPNRGRNWYITPDGTRYMDFSPRASHDSLGTKRH